MTNRRDFLKLVSSAAIAAAAGAALSTEQMAVLARHRYAYSIYDDWIVHRLDVRVGDEMVHVDVTSNSTMLTERQLQPAIEVLENYMRHKGMDANAAVLPAREVMS